MKLFFQHLWHLAVKEASLFIHLKYMKDFLLLGRGELFNEFIRTTTSVLNKAPNNNIKRGMLLILEQLGFTMSVVFRCYY